MVRIWIALLHQEKPVHNVYWFFFFGAEEDLNRAAAHSAVSNQPGGLLLSPRFPTCRNVYREADCPLSFLFYISIDCTGVEDALDVTMARRSEPDYLIYNDPLAYADLILNGDPEEYLKNTAGSHGLED